MKKSIILICIIMVHINLKCQNRTVIIPAPQPPGVPLDGGIIGLLIAGGAVVNQRLKQLK
jgi:hypothetical protein